MPRRKRAVKRNVLPDPKYKLILVTKFISGIMKSGKRSLAERIFYSAIDTIEEKTKKNGIEVFQQAVSNVRPVLEVKSLRVGGATYQVPIEVNNKRAQALAIRWLIRYARERQDKTMAEALASELIAAFNKDGASIKKREDTHKMAEANKAFAHFRW